MHRKSQNENSKPKGDVEIPRVPGQVNKGSFDSLRMTELKATYAACPAFATAGASWVRV
jgi:hypothetical protein